MYFQEKGILIELTRGFSKYLVIVGYLINGSLNGRYMIFILYVAHGTHVMHGSITRNPAYSLGIDRDTCKLNGTQEYITTRQPQT